MNKIKYIGIAALVLGLCVAICACRIVDETPKTQPSTTVSQQETHTSTPDTQATEGQQPEGTVDPYEQVGTGRPTIDYETEVGSGREEGTTVQPETKPSTETTVPADELSMNYSQYMSLSGAQQQAFFDKYFADDPIAFATWFQKIKQEHVDETPEIVATGPVDLEDYINP